MVNEILEQIIDNGKKILDIDDVNSCNNNYGTIKFTNDESDGIIAKNITTLKGIGYSIENGAETFNSYPNEDNLTYNSDNYTNNNNINKAYQEYSHARNLGTVANDHQAESSLGQYNISSAYNNNEYGSVLNTSTSLLNFFSNDNSLEEAYTTDVVTNALLIIGDGINYNNRHNLLTIRSSCTGEDGAGTLSFSGDVDIDGHLNVANYVASPTIYTDTLCYTNGEQY